MGAHPYKPGDVVVFAGGKYSVDSVFSDENILGQMTDYVVIGRWQVPVAALNTKTGKVKPGEEEKKKAKIIAAREKLRARAEKEAEREKKPMRFKLFR